MCSHWPSVMKLFLTPSSGPCGGLLYPLTFTLNIVSSQFHYMYLQPALLSRTFCFETVIEIFLRLLFSLKPKPIKALPTCLWAKTILYVQDADGEVACYVTTYTVQFETEGNGQNEIFSHMNRSEVKL